MRTCGSGMASPPRLSGATGQFFEPQGYLVDPPVDKGQGTSTIKSSEVPSCPSDPNETTRIVPEDFWSTNGCPQWSAGTSRSTHRGPAHSGGASSFSRSGARGAPPLSLCVFRLVLLGIQTSRAHRSDRPPRIGRRCYAVAVDPTPVAVDEQPPEPIYACKLLCCSCRILL